MFCFVFDSVYGCGSPSLSKDPTLEDASKGHLLSSKCHQEPLVLRLQQQQQPENQPCALTDGGLSSCVSTTGYRFLEGSGVIMHPHISRLGPREAWDLWKDTQQVRVRVQVCQTPCPGLFALYPTASDVAGLSLGWRLTKQKQRLCFEKALLLSSFSLQPSPPPLCSGPLSFLLLHKSTEYFPSQRL